MRLFFLGFAFHFSEINKNPDVVLNPSQVDYDLSVTHVAYPYADPYRRGLAAACGPHAVIQPQPMGMAPTRVPLPFDIVKDGSISSMQNSIMEFSGGVSQEQGWRPRANSSKPIIILLSLHILKPTAPHMIISTMPYPSTPRACPLSLMPTTTP